MAEVKLWSVIPCPQHLCLQANAISTFNVLNQEGRKVMGLFLPQGTDPESS